MRPDQRRQVEETLRDMRRVAENLVTLDGEHNRGGAWQAGIASDRISAWILQIEAALAERH